MTKLEKLAKKARTGVNDFIEDAETRLRAAGVRNPLRKQNPAASVAKQAAKAALVAGAVVAVTAAVKQVRHRRSGAR